MTTPLQHLGAQLLTFCTWRVRRFDGSWRWDDQVQQPRCIPVWKLKDAMADGAPYTDGNLRELIRGIEGGK